ncbi:MAG: cysteine-rich CWC family protein [Betaproteobacteria bacterium]
MDLTNENSCAECGSPFHCGMEDANGCWCATELPLFASGTDGSGCLCKVCLQKLLASQLKNQSTE